MKSRRVIVNTLSIGIILLVCFEFLNSAVRRSGFPTSSLSELEVIASSLSSSNFRDTITVISFAEENDLVDHGYRTRKPTAREQFLRESCCTTESAKCAQALEEYSDSTTPGEGFNVIFDPTCKRAESVTFDQCSFTVDLESVRSAPWLPAPLHNTSGVFRSFPPLAVLRFILVNGDPSQSKRIVWDPQHTIRPVNQFLGKLSPVTEVITDTSQVYSADISNLLDSLSKGDMYDRSRILNAELEVWQGSPHLLEFGAYAMPPVWHYATVLAPSDIKEVFFEVESWGTVQIIHSSKLLACGQDQCDLTSGAIVSNSVISVLRSQLGLMSDKCLGFTECKSGLSRSEQILLNARFHVEHVKSIIASSSKQLRILDALPRLAFPPEVSLLTEEAHQLGIASIADKDVSKCKLGAAKAENALRHESVVAPPHFSYEFMFGLYGPLALPVILPVLGAVIKDWRKSRLVKQQIL